MIEVKDLEVCFTKDGKEYPAVKELSYSVGEGEILGIVGESGCGKSISSLALMGLLPRKCHVTKGSMRVLSPAGSKSDSTDVDADGTEITDFSPENLTKFRGDDISMIFQEPMTALNPLLTVGRQIREAYEVHHKGCSREEAYLTTIDIMKKVGLPRPEQLYRDFPHQLSGGMRQRVVIAMALINKPAVIIADEPTTALDVTIQAQILRLLERLNREEGTSVILISHDLGVIRRICSKMLVMYAGTVVEMGDAELIFKAPKHPYSRGLGASIPTGNKKGQPLYTIPGTVPDLYKRKPGQCVFCERCIKAMDRCKCEEPQMHEVDGRMVRCFLYDKNETV